MMSTPRSGVIVTQRVDTCGVVILFCCSSLPAMNASRAALGVAEHGIECLFETRYPSDNTFLSISGATDMKNRAVVGWLLSSRSDEGLLNKLPALSTVQAFTSTALCTTSVKESLTDRGFR